MRVGLAASLSVLFLMSMLRCADAQWTTNRVAPPFNNVEINCSSGPPPVSYMDDYSKHYPVIPNTANSRIEIRAFDGFWPNDAAFETVALDSAAMTRQLDMLRERIHEYCEQVAATTPNWDANRGAPGIPDFYLITLHYTTRGDLLAYAPSLTDGWTVLENGARAEILRQRAFQRGRVAQAQLAVRQAQTALQQKLAVQRRFAQRYGVSQWVGGAQVVANPFLFQNQVVAINAQFVRMVSRTDALFSTGAAFVVSGVPSTSFRGGESVVLAVRVAGMRSIDGASVPDLRLVGVYRCRSNCGAEIWPY